MSQEDLSNMKSDDNKRPENTDQDGDNSSTVVPSITYSRHDGNFTPDSQNEGSLFNDNDNISTVVEGNVHSFGTSNVTHHRSLSNEHMISSQLSQWNYNNNRVILNRSILQLRDLLQHIDIENEHRPVNIRNCGDLHVLQVNFRLDGNYHNNNQNKNDIDLDKEAMAKLFKTQINTALNHLNSLQKRVDDVSSKVFITGDLNTGKSAFCNSLLGRHLLPEDQLPCTNVFCEILEARENDNIEEVHAILNSLAPTVKDCADKYKIRDQTTYEVHTLDELDELVLQNDKYALLKIYIKDNKRPAERSLLRNGTVDISLIDSPGLNIDSVQTSEVMARQEEIDLVIFVVNAENQLTLSAKEFIGLASREKKLMFFVVKKFDKIKDKERCKRLILDQIKDLSPESYKRAPEFVHFLSQEDEIPNGGDYPSDDDDDDNNNDANSDPDFENLENSLRNFVLKRRSQSKLLPGKTYLSKILSDINKISESNLGIFKEEDNKITEELTSLGSEISKVVNRYDVFTKSIDRLADETITNTYDFTKSRILGCLDISTYDLPQYQGLSKIYDFIFVTEHFIKDQIRDSIVSSEMYAKGQTQTTVETIYSNGRVEFGEDFMHNRVFDSELMFTKNSHILSKQFSVPLNLSDLFAPTWEGLFEYLTWSILTPVKILCDLNPNKLKNKLIKKSTTEETEVTHDESKIETSLFGLGDYPLIQYWKRPSLIFTSKLPALAIYSFGGSKIITTVVINGMKALSIRSLGQMAGSLVIVCSLLGISYFVHDLPRALPHNLLNKYKQKLEKLDYIHKNSKRISNEVHDVLKTPTREILKTCELLTDKKQESKRHLERQQANNKISIQFFEQILQRTTAQQHIVDAINLDID